MLGVKGPPFRSIAAPAVSKDCALFLSCYGGAVRVLSVSRVVAGVPGSGLGAVHALCMLQTGASMPCIYCQSSASYVLLFW